MSAGGVSWGRRGLEWSFPCLIRALAVLPAAGTPFAGGLFRMKLVFGPEFPQLPPKGAPCGAGPSAAATAAADPAPCSLTNGHCSSCCALRPCVPWASHHCTSAAVPGLACRAHGFSPTLHSRLILCPLPSPTGYFLTKIFHPNVSSTGDICVNVLKRDWTPDMGLRHVLTVIRCLLIEPNPDSALNDEAGKLLNEGFEEFAKKARLMTDIHARKPSVLTAAGGANAVNADGPSGEGAGKPTAAAREAPTGAAAASNAKTKAAAKSLGDKKRSLKRL